MYITFSLREPKVCASVVNVAQTWGANVPGIYVPLRSNVLEKVQNHSFSYATSE